IRAAPPLAGRAPYAKHRPGMRRVYDGKPTGVIGVAQGKGPGDNATPVMPHYAGLALAQRLNQSTHVGGQRCNIIAARRFVGEVITAQVRRDYTAVGLQRWQLKSETIPELWEAMKQQHQRPCAAGHIVQPQASDVSVALLTAGWQWNRLLFATQH